MLSSCAYKRLTRDARRKRLPRPAAAWFKKTIRREENYCAPLKNHWLHTDTHIHSFSFPPCSVSSRAEDTDVVFRVLYERGFFWHRRNENTLFVVRQPTGGGHAASHNLELSRPRPVNSCAAVVIRRRYCAMRFRIARHPENSFVRISGK